jgi:alkanesulfonate monooxygenase SsuD/methylene tetrahydromethanopterin reductase-like flavin-dependent oxidoreductase (luciferase family)
LKLAIALTWHVLPFEELLALVRRAEALGFSAVYVDGDVSLLARRRDVLDGWTLTGALLARTERIEIGSIRLVTHWNAARLAQAVATQERITPGRLRFLISVGAQPIDRRFGLPFPPAPERIARLRETLDALRALWRGEVVTRRGAHVQLEEAWISPVPARPIPIAVAGRGPALLEVVAEQADAWDVNLPALAPRVSAAAARLDAACRRLGRDPRTLRRSMWIFTRPGWDPADPRLPAEFRRWNPWFAELAPGEIAEAVVAGSGDACRQRLQALAAALGLDEPVADLSGLDAAEAARALALLAPEKR